MSRIHRLDLYSSRLKPAGPKGPALTRPYSGPRGIFVMQAFFQDAEIATPLATDGLLTCSALALIDRRAGWHYLAHVDQSVDSLRVRESFADYDLAESEIFILRGPLANETGKLIMSALRMRGAHRQAREVAFPTLGFPGITIYQGRLYQAPPRGSFVTIAQRAL